MNHNHNKARNGFKLYFIKKPFLDRSAITFLQNVSLNQSSSRHPPKAESCFYLSTWHKRIYRMHVCVRVHVCVSFSVWQHSCSSCLIAPASPPLIHLHMSVYSEFAPSHLR